MNRINIELGPLTLDGPMGSAAERFLNITASLRITVDGVSVLDELAVPVLELAAQLDMADLEHGFVYTSVESDYALLIVLPWKDGMFIASPMSGTCAEKAVSKDAVRVAFTDMRMGLDRILATRHIDIPRDTRHRANPFL
ncbi:hypothetical protein LYSHEL_23030 [Lysobacter helvus]|uniref:Uncharacterized protein n=2 Tax=Lysobacteraceae TaxID=32033 RepID=A0ABN6FV10_9GAMM|nr:MULTISPECIES: hypothetical protein [Lysobacter]BCT93279.1 hypothetical protein LYSCAS_23030 [Lysobacter caseinilyticus]BCT96432.1 hypothetical protein LYSHEL_23030 [Lysobacter helvus]